MTMNSKYIDFKIKTQSNISIKEALKSVFKNYIFILFSFVNMFIPLYATIISALIGPHGSINVTVVGLTISFISIFNQFIFLLALTMVFVLNRDTMFDHKNKNVDKHTISTIMLIYSSFTMLLFVGSALLYIRYSTLYKGFSESFDYTLQFVLLIAPTFIINGFVYLNIIYRLESHKFKSISYYLIFFILHLCLLPLFYIAIPWPQAYQLCGLGLGFLLSSILTLMLVYIFNFEKGWKKDFSVNWKELRSFVSRSGNFVWDFLLAVVMKGFLVMAIGLSLNLSAKPTFPSLMIAKILWYNSLFFCGFFGDGLFYAIEYTKMKIIAANDSYLKSNKITLTFSMITLMATLIICTIFNFAAMGLADVYVKHESQDIFGMYPNAKQVKQYLYCSSKNVLSPLTGNYTTTFAFGYLTIYHCVINSFKIMNIKETKINQPFSWLKVLIKFIVLVIIMAWIATFAVAFNDASKYGSFIDTFNGLDTFSFAIMTVGLVMFVPAFPKLIINCFKE